MELSDIQDIDASDLGTWPTWFRWVVIFIVGALILYFGYTQIVEPEKQHLEKLQREETQLRETYLIKKSRLCICQRIKSR